MANICRLYYRVRYGECCRIFSYVETFKMKPVERICDFCNVTVLSDSATPSGWELLKVDARTDGKIGGLVFKLLCCEKCWRYPAWTSTKERAIDFLKSALSIGPA